jgi:hypothetical protein
MSRRTILYRVLVGVAIGLAAAIAVVSCEIHNTMQRLG